jgi:hypothetical protein
MFIQPQMRKQADVVRLSVTKDSNGDTVAEDYTVIYGTHVIDLQPRELSDGVGNDQIKYGVTHFVFPERVPVMSYARLGDFYRVNSKLYRVIKRYDYVDEVYFEVRDEAPEQATSIAVAVQNSFIIDNLGPGVYVYGSGLLLGVGPFSTRPLLIETLMNDGGGYFANPTVTGFEIVNTGEGASPIYTILVKGILA